jgi:hypothetical protein
MQKRPTDVVIKLRGDNLFVVSENMFSRGTMKFWRTPWPQSLSLWSPRGGVDDMFQVRFTPLFILCEVNIWSI